LVLGHSLGSLHSDLIVVGAGIVGASITYFAHKAGRKNLILIDRGTVGSGASNFSAGFDAIESASDEHRALAVRSRKLYRAMSEDIAAASVVPLSTLWVVNRRRVDKFCLNFATDDSRPELPRHITCGAPPEFRIPPDREILKSERDGFARPGEVSRGIVHYLNTHCQGFACHENTEVIAIKQSEVSAEVVLSDGRHISANKLILAVGAWLLDDRFAAALPRAARLKTKKIASFIINCCPNPTAPALVFHEEEAFFLPLLSENCWLFCFRLDSWSCPPQAPAALNYSEMLQGRRLLEMLAPSFANKISAVRAAVDLYSPSRAPLLTTRPFGSAVIIAGACSGAGYRIAPALAQNCVRNVCSVTRSVRV
jgi:glycine/D-amino acid oxidase-like deaminating enzyme